jgi:glycosyltransferase involved in cell wall biosynthesis
MISLAIPVYEMPNKDFFLERCLNSIRSQSYQDFEIVITENGKGMASNTNEAIRQSKGDLIKILYMDDYLAHKDALKKIVEGFKGYWLATGCLHDSNSKSELFNPHYPSYNDEIHLGKNTIGSPSVVTIKNGLDMYFDESMTWLLDCDFYRRLHDKYGEPTLLNDMNVAIGVGQHQATHIMGDEIKINEHEYMQKKYDTTK